ncbi:DUF2948 family protein [Marinibacterium sp. SX1]|uniref:DUF2948 family protein n=1 Tax=Marinibacterium sp. SX1 TaxID=3388424 RepID=UPI003D185F68
MTEDARFEDGREAPLYLGALDAEDLGVLAALVQDAVFPITEMTWRPKARQFALLLNRFRWEDAPAAERRSRSFERVQSVLSVENVLRVASQGIDRGDKDIILSLLSVSFEPGEDGTGHVLLTLAGDGAIRLQVEALDVTLRDVTRPYQAPSGKAPEHGA